MELLLANASFGMVIGGITVGATLNREDRNGQAPPLQPESLPAQCPLSALSDIPPVAKKFESVFVPLVVPAPDNRPKIEQGGAAQDFLEFLEGLETPKGIPSSSKERKLELEREMEEEWEKMFEEKSPQEGKVSKTLGEPKGKTMFVEKSP